MKIAAIVPHLKPYGGIRRFLEVGNVMASRGHDYTVYVKEMVSGDSVGWMNYQGKLRSWKDAELTFEADAIMIGDPHTLNILEDSSVTIKGKVYIWVIAAGIPSYLELYKKFEKKGYTLMLNTRLYYKLFGPGVALCEGGVNKNVFTPKTVRVGYYAGRGGNKGEYYIEESLKGIQHVIPVPIKGLDTPDLVRAYKSLDYFVCAEVPHGWSNMAAEAIACGIPVVSCSENTAPFLNRAINVTDLRAFFENPMQQFSWENVCTRLGELFGEPQ